jgi:hypothetical protein
VSRYLAVLLLVICCRSAGADTLAFISDLNGRYGSIEYHQRVSEAVADIIAQAPSLVVIGGDMIAGQATPLLDEATVEAMWQNFDKTVYQPLKAAGIPVAATPGNHDASAYPLFSAERIAYERYWSARPPAESYSDGSSFPWYFGVDLDGLSLAFLDVTTTAVLDSTQQGFLRLRREHARARGARLVVVTHLPLHPIAQGRETETFSVPGSSLPGETWVSGHHHAYYPGVRSNGAFHLALPALGGNSRRWIGSTERSPFGYVRLEPRGSVALHPWPGFRPGGSPAWPTVIGELRAVGNIPAEDN